jgi:hypothetical protein
MPTGAYPISSHIPHLVARSEAPAGQGPAANPGPQGGRLNGSCPVAGDPEDPLTAPLQIFSPQPSLARGGAHTQLTQPPLSHSSPRIAAVLVGPPPLTRFSLCSLSLSSLVLSLLSLSLSPVSSGNPRFPPPVTFCLLVDASTRVVYPPSRPIHMSMEVAEDAEDAEDAEMERKHGHEFQRKEVCRGQIAIALYHSRRRTASARSVVEKRHLSTTAKGREWE